MTISQVIASLITLCAFFGTCFFWLWTRLEEKRKEDKASFIAIFERLRIIDTRIAYLYGKGGDDETPTIRL